VGKSSKPYGMTSAQNVAAWYSEADVEPNAIVRFDPKTHTFAKWPISSGGGIVRNMAATPQGDIYIACSGVDKVGVVQVANPASREAYVTAGS
jgi:streptogramin lyase